MTLTIKDPHETTTPGKQGSTSQNSQSNPAESARTNPVCLEVGVTIRSLPNEAGGLSKPIREEVKTVIVFDNGAVLRCAENLPAGYTVILSNSNGRDVVCKVVAGRNMPNIKGYVEVQFMESVSDFWSTYQGGGPAVPASSPAVPLALREPVVTPPAAAPTTHAIALPAVPPKPTPIALGAAPTPEEIGGPSSAPIFTAQRESKTSPTRPGPASMAPNPSSYSHAESAKQSTIGNWNSSDSDADSEIQALPSTREPSSGPARDFMSKGLMAYDKPASPAASLNGRMPMIVGAAVLALAGVGAVVFFMHRNAAPAPITTSAIINKLSTPQTPEAASVPDPVSAPPEASSPSAMNAQPAAQPVAVEQPQASSALTAIPAVVTSPVTSDSGPNTRSARKPEKNAIAAKPREPLPAPRPAMTDLKMTSPSAPARRAIDSGAGAAPIAEISASEAAGGTPSGLLTSSGRISNPPAPPPSAPAPIAASKTASAPKLISSTRLAYPQAARQTNIQGMVMVSASIDETGKVVSANALSGPLLLREAAVNSVKQWKYSPGLLDGKPAPSQVTVGVEFKLN